MPAGKYFIAAHSGSWGGGSATLQVKLPDGTFITAATAFAADGTAVVEFPDCVVQVAIATTTSVTFACLPIVYQQALR